MCRSRTDHEICPIIDDNAMTRRRGLTLTLDQLTRTNPLRVPLSLYHPQSVVQCYCTYMCQVNSHIYETGLYTGWIVPVGMQFHDYMAKQFWMNVDVLNQWHAAPDDLGIIPSTIRKLCFFLYSFDNFNFIHYSFENESKNNYKNNNCKGKDFRYFYNARFIFLIIFLMSLLCRFIVHIYT